MKMGNFDIYQYDILGQPYMPILDFDELSYIKCYLGLLKGLFQPMLGGSRLLILEFDESAQINLISKNF